MPLPSSAWGAYVVNRYLVGVSLLLGVVFLWTASNFITASLETGDDAWNKPFLITYFNTASFTIYLLPTIWRRYKHRASLHPHHPSPSVAYLPLPTSPVHPQHPTLHPHPRSRTSSPSHNRRSSSSLPRSTSPRARLHALPPATSGSPNASFELERPLLPEEEGVTVQVLPRLSVKETAQVAAWWSLVWFIANWAVNASLAWASVASVTILSSTSGFFTLALGRICGVESLTSTKLLSVVASFLGVLLVTHSDATVAPSDLPSALVDAGAAGNQSHPILGDVLALTSAAFYAVYVILLKVRVVDEERADMQLMLGFAGLFNTICLIPVFPILHYTGIERFELPPTRAAWLICLFNFCITLSSDYLYVLAMLKTTPTLVTVGLSLTIPLALVGSLFLPTTAGTESITPWSLGGAALVCVGFGMLGWQEYEKSRQGGVVVVGGEVESAGERPRGAGWRSVTEVLCSGI